MMFQRSMLLIPTSPVKRILYIGENLTPTLIMKPKLDSQEVLTPTKIIVVVPVAHSRTVSHLHLLLVW